MEISALQTLVDVGGSVGVVIAITLTVYHLVLKDMREELRICRESRRKIEAQVLKLTEEIKDIYKSVVSTS